MVKDVQTPKKTQEQFEKEVYDLVGDEYKVVGKYISGGEKIEIKHVPCGTVFTPRAVDFLRGYRCPNPECNKYVRPEWGLDGFIKRIEDKFGEDEYEVIGEYVNSKTPVKVKHIKCGTVLNVKPEEFIKTQGCYKCSEVRTKRKTHEEFVEKLKEIQKEAYI